MDIFGYSEDLEGYKLTNLSTKKYFIERSVQFQEDPLVGVEVGESSSSPDPLIVARKTNKFVEQVQHEILQSNKETLPFKS